MEKEEILAMLRAERQTPMIRDGFTDFTEGVRFTLDWAIRSIEGGGPA